MNLRSSLQLNLCDIRAAHPTKTVLNMLKGSRLTVQNVRTLCPRSYLLSPYVRTVLIMESAIGKNGIVITEPCFGFRDQLGSFAIREKCKVVFSQKFIREFLV